MGRVDTVAPDHAAPGRDSRRTRVAAACTQAPDRLIMLFGCASVAVMALLLGRVFEPYLAVALTLLLFAVSWPLGLRWSLRPHSAAASVVAVAFAAAWVGVNARYFEQMLSVYRDPAIYALRGWWLTDHASPLIDMTGSQQGLTGVPSGTVVAGGFPVQGHEAIPQGASLVPGLLAVAGRIGGLRVMLAANLVIGAVALLFVYALARRLMGPVWGLVPMVCLALTMPMVYFARATYTEPAALAAVFGGLVYLVAAMRSGRGPQFFLAGFLIGIGMLARADGVVAVAGALAAVGIAAGLSSTPERRRTYRRGIVLLGIGGLITSGAGWLDLTIDSGPYYSAIAGDVRRTVLAAVAVFVLGLAVSAVPARRVRSRLVERSRPIAYGLAGITALACALLISRPRWWVARATTSQAGLDAVASRQKSLGLPVDPSRTYAEHTVSWMAWYVTWPVVVLAAAGFTALAYRSGRRRDGGTLAVLAVVGVVSVVYLNLPSITPDQIWASRRLLPVILPGTILAAVYAIWLLSRRRRWRAVAAAAAVLTMLAPLLAWGGLSRKAEFRGGLAAVQAVCGHLATVDGTRRSHVVLAGAVPDSGYWSPAVQIVCGADVVTIPAPTGAELRRVARNWHGAHVTVMTFYPASVDWTTGGTPPPTFEDVLQIWNQPLTQRPTATISTEVRIWMGELTGDGGVTPLPSG